MFISYSSLLCVCVCCFKYTCVGCCELRFILGVYVLHLLCIDACMHVGIYIYIYIHMQLVIDLFVRLFAQFHAIWFYVGLLASLLSICVVWLPGCVLHARLS